MTKTDPAAENPAKKSRRRRFAVVVVVVLAFFCGYYARSEVGGSSSGPFGVLNVGSEGLMGTQLKELQSRLKISQEQVESLAEGRDRERSLGEARGRRGDGGGWW